MGDPCSCCITNECRKILKIPTVPESVARTVRRHMKDAELWEKDRCGCPVCRRFRKNLKMEKENARKETPQS